MRYGFWLPVFGGWLRNLDDEKMETSWAYTRTLCQRAKQPANIDRISGGRLTLNVVSSWWRDEATKYGIPFDEHDQRYARTSEWIDVVDGCWRQQHFTHQGALYNVQDNILSPKPAPARRFTGLPVAPPTPHGRPTLY